MKKSNLSLLIIGLVVMATLIAGGTYAYLSYSATVTNGTYANMTTRSFTFTAPAGTSVTNLYPFPHQPPRNGITNGNGYIVLSIQKLAGTPKASSVKIIAKFDTMQVNVADYIKVAICRSATASTCNNSASSNIPSTASNSDWVVVNKSILNNTSEQVLWEDTSSTGTAFNVDGAASMTYYVYFWLNAEVVTNQNAAALSTSQVKGAVYFYATQGV